MDLTASRRTYRYVVDTLRLARRLVPAEASFKLGHLTERFGLAKRDGAPAETASHRAGYDVLMCARLLLVLADTVPKLTLFDLLHNPPEIPLEDSDAPPLF